MSLGTIPKDLIESESFISWISKSFILREVLQDFWFCLKLKIMDLDNEDFLQSFRGKEKSLQKPSCFLSIAE